MKHLFEEKVINQGYLISIQGDLDWRLSIGKGEVVSEETLKERMEVLENHTALLNTVAGFIETLWTQNQQLRKNEEKRLQNRSI